MLRMFKINLIVKSKHRSKFLSSIITISNASVGIIIKAITTPRRSPKYQLIKITGIEEKIPIPFPIFG